MRKLLSPNPQTIEKTSIESFSAVMAKKPSCSSPVGKKYTILASALLRGKDNTRIYSMTAINHKFRNYFRHEYTNIALSFEISGGQFRLAMPFRMRHNEKKFADKFNLISDILGEYNCSDIKKLIDETARLSKNDIDQQSLRTKINSAVLDRGYSEMSFDPVFDCNEVFLIDKKTDRIMTEPGFSMRNPMHHSIDNFIYIVKTWKIWKLLNNDLNINALLIFGKGNIADLLSTSIRAVGWRYKYKNVFDYIKDNSLPIILISQSQQYNTKINEYVNEARHLPIFSGYRHYKNGILLPQNNYLLMTESISSPVNLEATRLRGHRVTSYPPNETEKAWPLESHGVSPPVSKIAWPNILLDDFKSYKNKIIRISPEHIASELTRGLDIEWSELRQVKNPPPGYHWNDWVRLYEHHLTGEKFVIKGSPAENRSDYLFSHLAGEFILRLLGISTTESHLIKTYKKGVEFIMPFLKGIPLDWQGYNRRLDDNQKRLIKGMELVDLALSIYDRREDHVLYNQKKNLLYWIDADISFNSDEVKRNYRHAINSGWNSFNGKVMNHSRDFYAEMGSSRKDHTWMAKRFILISAAQFEAIVGTAVNLIPDNTFNSEKIIQELIKARFAAQKLLKPSSAASPVLSANSQLVLSEVEGWPIVNGQKNPLLLTMDYRLWTAEGHAASPVVFIELRRDKLRVGTDGDFNESSPAVLLDGGIYPFGDDSSKKLLSALLTDSSRHIFKEIKLILPKEVSHHFGGLDSSVAVRTVIIFMFRHLTPPVFRVYPFGRLWDINSYNAQPSIRQNTQDYMYWPVLRIPQYQTTGPPFIFEVIFNNLSSQNHMLNISYRYLFFASFLLGMQAYFISVIADTITQSIDFHTVNKITSLSREVKPILLLNLAASPMIPSDWLKLSFNPDSFNLEVAKNKAAASPVHQGGNPEENKEIKVRINELMGWLLKQQGEQSVLTQKEVLKKLDLLEGASLADGDGNTPGSGKIPHSIGRYLSSRLRIPVLSCNDHGRIFPWPRYLNNIGYLSAKESLIIFDSHDDSYDLDRDDYGIKVEDKDIDTIDFASLSGTWVSYVNKYGLTKETFLFVPPTWTFLNFADLKDKKAYNLVSANLADVNKLINNEGAILSIDLDYHFCYSYPRRIPSSKDALREEIQNTYIYLLMHLQANNIRLKALNISYSMPEFVYFECARYIINVIISTFDALTFSHSTSPLSKENQNLLGAKGLRSSENQVSNTECRIPEKSAASPVVNKRDRYPIGPADGAKLSLELGESLGEGLIYDNYSAIRWEKERLIISILEQLQQPFFEDKVEAVRSLGQLGIPDKRIFAGLMNVLGSIDTLVYIQQLELETEVFRTIKTLFKYQPHIPEIYTRIDKERFPALLDNLGEKIAERQIRKFADFLNLLKILVIDKYRDRALKNPYYPYSCDFFSNEVRPLFKQYSFSHELKYIEYNPALEALLAVNCHYYWIISVDKIKFGLDIAADQFTRIKDNEYKKIAPVVIPLSVITANPRKYPMYTGISPAVEELISAASPVSSVNQLAGLSINRPTDKPTNWITDNDYLWESFELFIRQEKMRKEFERLTSSWHLKPGKGEGMGMSLGERFGENRVVLFQPVVR
ncbi:MAG: hypothetical protein AAB213_00545 [Candidatus Omnitrophota bacterium]